MRLAGRIIRGETPFAKEAISAAVNATDQIPTSAISPPKKLARVVSYLTPMFVVLNEDALGLLLVALVTALPPSIYAVREVVDVKTPAMCAHVFAVTVAVVSALAATPPVVELLARKTPVAVIWSETLFKAVAVDSETATSAVAKSGATQQAIVTGNAVLAAPAYSR